MNTRKPTATRPSTPSTRATMASGSWRENSDTASIQLVSMKCHSSSEPSWPPQTPAMRYIAGRLELECCTT